MSRSIEIAINDETDNERIVEVYAYVIHASSPDYFSRQMGCWYPGDPAEFYVEGARWQDTGKDLSEAEWAKHIKVIEEKAYKVASEPDEPDPDRCRDEEFEHGRAA